VPLGNGAVKGALGYSAPFTPQSQSRCSGERAVLKDFSRLPGDNLFHKDSTTLVRNGAIEGGTGAGCPLHLAMRF
jgi:hypothetical protein